MRFVFLLISLVGCLTVAIPAAEASLSGFADWRYAEYRAEEEGQKVSDASHFAQHYSLLYQKSARISGGRAGFYKLALGAEWLSFDSEVNGESIHLDTAKILYRGEVVIAPGGLPFRLNLFSRDLKDSSFQTYSRENPILSALVTPSIITDVSNGSHIISGATLLLGIRNGSYMGIYRDVLSQLPRILIDFKQEDVKDLKSKTPVHYRIRDLAFVSLNKKDNWLHYRHFDYTDFLNSDEDFVEKSITLGTIDHTMARRWINLTNWIQVSADGTLTTTENQAGLEPVEHRFDLHLYGKARRTSWEGSSLSSFSRIDRGDILEKNLDIPFYLSGEFNRDTSWRFRFQGSRDRYQNRGQGSQIDDDSVFASALVETFRQAPYIVTARMESEVKSGERGEGYGLKAGADLRSNRRYNSRFDLFGSYLLTRLAGTDSEGGDVSYWEQDISAGITVDLSSRIRTGVEQRFVYGNGTLGKDVTNIISVRGGMGLVSEDKDFTERAGNVFHSTTTWFAEHRLGRLTNRFNLSYDFIATESDSSDAFTIGYRLGYRRRFWSFGMNNSMLFGEKLVENEKVDTRDFTHESFLRYSPGSAWEGLLTEDYNYKDDGITTSHTWNAEQELRYSFFVQKGLRRKLAEVEEKLEYERYTAISQAAQTRTDFTLSGTYFPSIRTLLKAEITYTTFSPADHDLIKYEFLAGINFQKLQLLFNYQYGIRTPDDNVTELKEQRWEVRVKKAF